MGVQHGPGRGRGRSRRRHARPLGQVLCAPGRRLCHGPAHPAHGAGCQHHCHRPGPSWDLEASVFHCQELARKDVLPALAARVECANEDELAEAAGCNLFTQTPEIRNWINESFADKELTVGSYAYLHGALHVQGSLAMDAIAASLIENGLNIRLASLCTPTDVFVCPMEARAAAAANHANAPAWQKLLSALTFGSKLVRNVLPTVTTDSGVELAIVDGLVTAQGPNYTLAKRIQSWRSVVSRESMNTPTSINVAPSTATKSVVDNKSFAAAYGGFRYFAAMEVFYQETSNAVMGTLLINDIRNEDSPANPSVKLDSPMQICSFNSFHGVVWRNGFKINSIGEVAALAYYVNVYMFQIFAGAVAATGLGYYIHLNGLPIEF